MLSSVLRSKRAIQANIAIMRTFVKLREILATNELLRHKIESMEKKYDEQFKVIFEVLEKPPRALLWSGGAGTEGLRSDKS